jgi:hypothetical protein
MDWKKILINLVLALLVQFTGILGIIITRIVKGAWNNQLWTYIPIFWIPILTSWPVALSVLFGFFDA